MQLRNVSFGSWLRSHGHKDAEERWLRELYPWPVFAQVDCAPELLGVVQNIVYDQVAYQVTLRGRSWQQSHGTFKYRLFVESDGLGWHSRSFSDEYDLAARPDGAFVTLFHRSKTEPLERIARAFFTRRWDQLARADFRSLAVSRFLAATLAVEVARGAYRDRGLEHYPEARLLGGGAPMLASGRELWIRHQFFSEDAYHWARSNADHAREVVALYFADTKHQFIHQLPANATVKSIAELDATFLDGLHYELIVALARRLDLPSEHVATDSIHDMLRGLAPPIKRQVSEADVHEALNALRRPCNSRADLRYQLAAGVVLNAWIEEERALGYTKRKRFYAFKQRIASLVEWALSSALEGIDVWLESSPTLRTPVVFIRVDGVDFGYHCVSVDERVYAQPPRTWNGVRLKPMAPLVLSWARAKLRDQV